MFLKSSFFYYGKNLFCEKLVPPLTFTSLNVCFRNLELVDLPYSFPLDDKRNAVEGSLGSWGWLSSPLLVTLRADLLC